MKRTAMITIAVLATLPAAVRAENSLGKAGLPMIHAEYRANEARWASKFEGKVLDVTLPLSSIDRSSAAFMESPHDWTPGVICHGLEQTDFTLSKNSGDTVRVRGVIEDHTLGMIDLKDCQLSEAQPD
jgi:hypothetical protein